MSSNGGSSSGSSGSGSSDREKKAPSPVAQSEAPRGAYLGTTTGSGATGAAGMGAGASLVSNGDGTATSIGGTSGGNATPINITLPAPAATESTATETKYLPVATPAPITPPAKPGPAETLYPNQGNGSGGGPVDTTVEQKPVGGGPAAPVDGPEGTTVTSGPRSDFSVVLAGQTGKRPERSAARSNNFVSLVGGAGGLGRKTSDAKRSLIGGA